MIDLAPTEHISLRDYYGRFGAWLWNGDDPFERLKIDERIAGLPFERVALHRAGQARVTDSCLAEALKPFKSGRLQSFVVYPPNRERGYLSERAWKEAFFPERMMMSDEIGAGHGPEFDVAVGRTPFVDLREVEGYFGTRANGRSDTPPSRALRQCLLGLVMEGKLGASEAETFAERWGLLPFEEEPPKDKYNPSREAVWTLPMTLTWIAWRNLESVRDSMDEVRSNTWVWFGFVSRIPLSGGTEWYEIDGEELRTLSR